MPQSEHETCVVYAWNADENDPLFRAAGRAALAGRTVPEWMTLIGFDDRVTDPDLLAEIQDRLGLPDRPDGAFTMCGMSHLVFYERST